MILLHHAFYQHYYKTNYHTNGKGQHFAVGRGLLKSGTVVKGEASMHHVVEVCWKYKGNSSFFSFLLESNETTVLFPQILQVTFCFICNLSCLLSLCACSEDDKNSLFSMALCRHVTPRETHDRLSLNLTFGSFVEFRWHFNQKNKEHFTSDLYGFLVACLKTVAKYLSERNLFRTEVIKKKKTFILRWITFFYKCRAILDY
jgi:hypothetical protein